MTVSTDYKAHISETFTRASTSYDHVGPAFFSYFGERLVEFGAIPIGSKVLDIACGRGAVLFPAADAVSDSGEVIGIDISKGMIDQVRQDIRLRDMENTQALVMDAENLEFADSRFDYVLCGLCLFFLPNLSVALKEFYRVLRPGGFIIASTFKKPPDDGLMQDFVELFKSFEDRAADVPEAETSELNTEREIKLEMLQAGFTSVEVKARRKTFYYRDVDEWWKTAWSHGHRGFLDRIPSNDLPVFRTRALEMVGSRATNKGIPHRWNLLFAKARRPIS